MSCARKKERLEAAELRAGIFQGYQDALVARTTTFSGNLKADMARFRKRREKSAVPVTVKLTDRAHYDLQEIEGYAVQRWGRTTADRYLEGIQTALPLLQENPDWLRHKSDISSHFKLYRVREYLLDCTKLKDVLLILTIKHGQMDLPHRIGKLEPTLAQEAAVLHQRLVAVEKNRGKPSLKK